jgi:hypothetical protein
MPKGHNLQPCTDDSDGVIILKNLISRTLDNIEENGYFKILTGCVWDNSGCERGVNCSSITLDYKKGTSSFNFQLNEPFLMFLQHYFLEKPYMLPGPNLQPLP